MVHPRIESDVASTQPAPWVYLQALEPRLGTNIGPEKASSETV